MEETTTLPPPLPETQPATPASNQLRQDAAIAALNGLCAGVASQSGSYSPLNTPDFRDQMADIAVKLADALVVQMNRVTPAADRQ